MMAYSRTEKRRPTYDLEAIKLPIGSIDMLAITTWALLDATALGLDRGAIVETIQSIDQRTFVKSMTTYADHWPRSCRGKRRFDVEAGSGRQIEIEPRRPCAGAEPETVPEMARRQAMGESETMKPAREQLVLRRDPPRRPAFGGREARLHFDRGASMSAHRRTTAGLGAAAPPGASTAMYSRARPGFAA